MADMLGTQLHQDEINVGTSLQNKLTRTATFSSGENIEVTTRKRAKTLSVGVATTTHHTNYLHRFTKYSQATLNGF